MKENTKLSQTNIKLNKSNDMKYEQQEILKFKGQKYINKNRRKFENF